MKKGILSMFFFGMFCMMLLMLETCSEKSYCLDGT